MDNISQAQQPQQRGGRGALAALAIVGILVGIGGACFGVYGMLSSSKTSTEDLKIKVEKEDGTVVELETDKIKEVSDDGTTITIEDNSKQEYDKLIYLNGYDLAFKIPKDTTMDIIQYEYRQFAGNSNYSYLVLNGATKEEGAQALPQFVTQMDDSYIRGLGVIQICRNEVISGGYYKNDSACNEDDDDIVYKNDDITIFYAGPGEGKQQMEDEWEEETIKELHKILSNKDNYVEVK